MDELINELKYENMQIKQYLFEYLNEDLISRIIRIFVKTCQFGS